MAKTVKRIEKEFLLKNLYVDQIPVIYLEDQTQYQLSTVEKPTKGQMFFKSDRPIKGLKVNKKINLMFDHRGQVITFSAKVTSIKGEQIIVGEPEILHKNLDRTFSRVSSPSGLHVKFSFLKDRYSLTYPKIGEYENVLEHGEFLKTLNPQDLNGLIGQMESWIKAYATGYKVVIFKDVKPVSVEERVLAKTGKAFFLPTTLGRLPQKDPYPKKRLITEEIYKIYLESLGVSKFALEEAYTSFIADKNKEGVMSDLWVPILFHEYVIGYIHIWIGKDAHMPLLDYAIVDTLFQFGKVLAYSLRLNKYFEDGKLENEPFEGNIIDISASGLLFAYPISNLSSALMTDIELKVSLITERRTIITKAKVVRRYKDKIRGYFGCIFMDMEPENMRYLFEYIYGKPFTDEDATFLFGQV